MYAFANAAPQASARLEALAYVFDPGTIRHLDARGVAAGWQCVEIGGGLGTMTRWLSARVGLSGSVLTTDIDTRHLEKLHLPNVEIRRHDVVEEPLPPSAFDLAYTRLVLQHVSDPMRALANIVQAVRPGGWIVIEDFESAALDQSLETVPKTFVAMRQVLAEAGANQRLGRSLSSNLRQCGLEDVGSEGRVYLWSTRNRGTTLMRLNAQQLRAPILATGIVTAAEFDEDLMRLDDEDFEFRSPILWTGWGRRPAQ